MWFLDLQCKHISRDKPTSPPSFHVQHFSIPITPPANKHYWASISNKPATTNTYFLSHALSFTSSRPIRLTSGQLYTRTTRTQQATTDYERYTSFWGSDRGITEDLLWSSLTPRYIEKLEIGKHNEQNKWEWRHAHAQRWLQEGKHIPILAKYHRYVLASSVRICLIIVARIRSHHPCFRITILHATPPENMLWTIHCLVPTRCAWWICRTILQSIHQVRCGVGYGHRSMHNSLLVSVLVFGLASVCDIIPRSYCTRLF